ncbi:hypothetical protein B7486_14170 [cyanobacterium TDX16]|nr:hypothetical protein B7486_14170 [cyanobacterium TDX16]
MIEVPRPLRPDRFPSSKGLFVVGVEGLLVAVDDRLIIATGEGRCRCRKNRGYQERDSGESKKGRHGK